MRWRLVIAMFIFAAAGVVLSVACAETYEPGIPVLVMPESLIRIEESAFENTAANGVILSEAVEYIGERAFADMPNFKVACIPEATSFIADDAFDGHDDLVIVGISGSYAHRWAAEHGYAFIHMDLWAGSFDNPIRRRRALRYTAAYETASAAPVAANRMGGTVGETTKAAPKDKPEMYPIDYDFP